MSTIELREVKKRILAFASKYKQRITIQIDNDRLICANPAFTKFISETGFPTCWREFCELLREHDFIYFPGERNELCFASLDVVDCKRKERQKVTKIEYSEEDVLS